jgi:hypothetical protein
MRHDTDRCDPADLQPYPDLVDFCALKDWRVGLAHTKTGWTLEVRENGELLAKATSSLSPARAIRDMSLRCSMALEKRRKLKG